MKKFLFLLVLLGAVCWGLQKWRPATLEHIPFLRAKTKPAPAQPAELPPMERAPIATPIPSTTATISDTAVTPVPTNPMPIDKTAQVVVLLYHRLEGTAGGALSIEPAVFQQHMQRLKDSNIAVISMADFLAWRRGEKSIPNRSAMITIDDGYVSAYEVARPILKEFGYPWTIFVYTKYVSSGGKSITWEQLRELAAEGVEIGSHSVSHLNLRTTPGVKPENLEAVLQEEIVNSKRIIEERTGASVQTFAYPEGAYTPHVLELVKSAGYRAAFTVYGQRVTHGASAERIGRYAWNSRRPQDIEMALRFTGPLSPMDLPENPAPARPLVSAPEEPMKPTTQP